MPSLRIRPDRDDSDRDRCVPSLHCFVLDFFAAIWKIFAPHQEFFAANKYILPRLGSPGEVGEDFCSGFGWSEATLEELAPLLELIAPI